jgi:hypothetical protein
MSCLATGMRNKRCASPHFSTGAQLAQLARSRCRCASAPVRQSPLGDGATGAARHPFLHGLLQLDLSDWRIYLTARGGIRAKRRMKDVYPGARGQVPSRAVAYSLGRIESGTLPGTRGCLVVDVLRAELGRLQDWEKWRADCAADERCMWTEGHRGKAWIGPMQMSWPFIERIAKRARILRRRTT